MTLLGWTAASGLAIAGPLREVHLFGHPELVADDDPAVLELVVPVRGSRGLHPAASRLRRRVDSDTVSDPRLPLMQPAKA